MSKSQYSSASSAAFQSKLSPMDPQRSHGCVITKGRKKISGSFNSNRSRNRIGSDIYNTCSSHAEVQGVKSLYGKYCGERGSAKGTR